MKKFSRKWEKIIAWTANILMAILALLVWGLYTIGIDGLKNDRAFKESLDATIRQGSFDSQGMRMLLRTDNVTADSFILAMEFLLKGSLGFMVAALVIALIASLVMKARIFSAVLFILAGVLSLPTFGFFLAVLYWIVAIILFIRKEKTVQATSEPIDQPLN